MAVSRATEHLSVSWRQSAFRAIAATRLYSILVRQAHWKSVRGKAKTSNLQAENERLRRQLDGTRPANHVAEVVCPLRNCGGISRGNQCRNSPLQGTRNAARDGRTTDENAEQFDRLVPPGPRAGGGVRVSGRLGCPPAPPSRAGAQ